MNDFKVLLVDDEEDFLTALTERLQNRGIDAQGVKSGEEALEALKSRPVDVVVLDVRMPGISGIDTLEAIKKEYPATEVLMLTGHADLETAFRGMDSGAFDYLVKPVDIDELIYRLQDAHQAKTLSEPEEPSDSGG